MIEKLKVMLIDDDYLVIEDLKNLVDWHKLDMEIVSIADNGQHALEKMDNIMPDIIITDIEMPIINGLDFAVLALKLSKYIKIILLTAFSRFEYAKKAIDLGASSYILKHEVSKLSLENELFKLSNEIFKERKEQKNEQIRLIEKLIANDGENKFVELLNSNNNYSRMNLLQIDRSYNEIGTPFEQIKSQFELYQILTKDISENILLIPINQFQVLWFYEIPLINSKLCEDKYNESLNEIKSNLKQKLNRTLSVFYIDTKLSTYEIVEDYNRLFKMSELSIILGKETINSYNNLKCKFTTYNNEKILWKNKIFNVTNDNIIQIKDSINSMIDQVTLIQYDYEIYLWLCNTIVDKLIEMDCTQKIKISNYLNECYSANQMKKIINDIIVDIYHSTIPQCSWKIKEVIIYIHNNYDKQITIEMIAQELSLSGEYLNKLFKKEIKMTFTQYLIEYRMKMAKKLLLTGEYKIYEVAKMVGYTTSQYFSMAFRKVNHMNPSDCLKD